MGVSAAPGFFRRSRFLPLVVPTLAPVASGAVGADQGFHRAYAVWTASVAIAACYIYYCSARPDRSGDFTILFRADEQTAMESPPSKERNLGRIRSDDLPERSNQNALRP